MQRNHHGQYAANVAGSKQARVGTLVSLQQWNVDNVDAVTHGRSESVGRIGKTSETNAHWAWEGAQDPYQLLLLVEQSMMQSVELTKAQLDAMQNTLDRLQSAVHRRQNTLQRPRPLSERTHEVLLLVEQRWSSKKIAAELCITANTVNTVITRTCKTLAVSGRQAAVQRARLLNLL